MNTSLKTMPNISPNRVTVYICSPPRRDHFFLYLHDFNNNQDFDVDATFDSQTHTIEINHHATTKYAESMAALHDQLRCLYPNTHHAIELTYIYNDMILDGYTISSSPNDPRYIDITPKHNLYAEHTYPAHYITPAPIVLPNRMLATTTFADLYQRIEQALRPHHAWITTPDPPFDCDMHSIAYEHAISGWPECMLHIKRYGESESPPITHIILSLYGVCLPAYNITTPTPSLDDLRCMMQHAQHSMLRIKHSAFRLTQHAYITHLRALTTCVDTHGAEFLRIIHYVHDVFATHYRAHPPQP